MDTRDNLPVVHGAAAVESHRAVAEAIAARKVAIANPRDIRRVIDQIVNDCASIELAEEATYQFARGGSDIVGPSIRLLEVVARRYGNIECGVKELSRGNGYSDVLTYAIDLETGFTDKKEFQVRHVRDTKQGAKAVRDERDIYEIVANQGARRKRACLEAVIPSDIKERAMKACEDTVKAKVQITPDLINRTVKKFADIGVTQEMIEKRIQRKMDAIQPGHIIQLGRIYRSLADDMSVIGDWFEVAPIPGEVQKPDNNPVRTGVDQMADELAAKAAKKPAETGASAPGGGSKTPEPLEDTGEITQAFVRKQIAEAKTQEQLARIFMGDMRKLDTKDPATRETTILWNQRVTALKVETNETTQAGASGASNATGSTEPVRAPASAPAGFDGAKAKAHGTSQVKAKLRAAMNRATTQAALDEAYAQVENYAWDEKDKTEMLERYNQCSADLKAG